MRYARELRRETQERSLEGDLSELEPITSRHSGSLEDPEKDSLLGTGGYYDADFASDGDYSRRLRPPYAIGENILRDSSADRGLGLELEVNNSVGSSSDTAVDDEGPFFKT